MATATLEKLYECSRHVDFDIENECYYWVKPHMKLKGASKTCKKRFYPRVSAPTKIKIAKTPKGQKRLPKGRFGGKLVHQQLQDFIENAKKGIKMEKLDPRVETIIREVIARGWMMVAGEYCVGNRDMRLGTGVDLLCLTAEGNPCVIEIKTGYDSVKYTGPNEKRLKQPFNNMDDSPYSQHQLQLLATKALFEDFTKMPAKHAEVWVVGCPVVNNKCPIHPFPLHPDIKDRGKEILTLLSVSPKKSKRKRMISMKEVPAKKQKKSTIEAV